MCSDSNIPLPEKGEKDNFSDTFILRRPRVANFADIIKIVTFFIKTTCKSSKEVIRSRSYVLKFNLYMYFLIEQKYHVIDLLFG